MDNELQISRPDATADENFPRLEKLTQSYLLLKQKICETHDIIKQYNDKQKDCDRLQTELETVKKQTRKMTQDYHTALRKSIKLEQQNAEYKKEIETLSTKVNDHEIKVAADKQHIQQLVCKIKDMEHQHNAKIMENNLEKSSFEVKVKELEQELKVARKSYDTKVKKMEKMEKKSPVSNLNNKCNKVTEEVKSTVEVGVNTSFVHETPIKKCAVREKCVMTTESYAAKENVYPVFCAKCDILLDPPPIEKICKVMTIDYPLIEQISSPSKRTPSPIRAPPEINPEYCKPQSLSILPEAASLIEAQNQTSNCDFAPLNLLNLHNSTLLNQTTCNKDLTPISPQIPEIANQCSYYVDSAAVTPLPLSTPNTTNQNNHCEAITSCLSSIKSLQSRLDTLEIKTKKRLSQKKLLQSSNCWQHKHPTACCMSSANNSFQSNSPFDLWRSMTDFYEWNEKKRFDKYKRYVDTKLKRLGMKRLKLIERKRLQSVSSNHWKVESLPERFQQSPLRRTKKRTYRYVRPINSDFVLNSMEDLEKYNSGSDTSTYSNEFNAPVPTVENRCSLKKKSSKTSRMKNLFSTSEIDVAVETSREPISSDTRVNDDGAHMEALRNAVESNKLVAAETDSGILSDSVESSKLAPIERRRDSPERENVEHNAQRQESTPNSPIGLIENNEAEEGNEDIPLNSVANVVTPPPTLNADVHVEVSDTEVASEKSDSPDITAFTPEKQIYVRTASRLFEDNESIENDQSETVENDEAEEAVFHSPEETLSPHKKQCLNRISSGARSKLNTPKSQKSCGSRQVLQKKLRNLKRSSKALSTHNDSLSNHRTERESTNTETSTNPKTLNNDNEGHVVTHEDYIPKKKSRIAHVPRQIVAEHSEPVPRVGESTQIETRITNDVQKKLQTCCTPKSVDDVIINRQEKLSTEFSNNDSEETQPSVSSVCENIIPNEVTVNNVQSNPIIHVNTHNIVQSTNIYAKPVHTAGLPNKFKMKKISFVKAKVEALGEINQANEGPDQRTVESLVTHVKNENTSDTPESNTAASNHDKSIIDEDSSINNIRSKNDVRAHVDRLSHKNYNYCENTVATPLLESSQCKGNQSNGELITEHLFEASDDEREAAQQEQTYANASSIDTLFEVKEDESKEEISASSDTFQCASVDEVTTITRTGSETVQNDVNTREEKIRQNAPFFRLTQYANQTKRVGVPSKKERKIFPRILRLANKYVMKQLQRLIDNDWELSLHCDILKKLKPISSARIIARCVMDVLSTDELTAGDLDKTHTPPAPLMTNMQQRFVTLLVDLEKSHPGILQLIQAAIEYKFFGLQKSLMRSVLESYTRIYTVIARIRKDREKVRIFCCDALYCLGINAITVLYTVFTCWPEVLPNSASNNDVLPKCIAHLIAAQQAETEFPRLNGLKKLVSLYYQYPSGGVASDLLKELLTALEYNPQRGIDTAIILLAKREGTSWTYKNVIRNALLPMIVNNRLANTYRAFSLLGNLLRPFPISDQDNSVGDIVEQLCDLINSGEGSEDQQEGVASALLSLSRHKFDKVAVCLIDWTPLKPLYPRTVKQINGFAKMRNFEFWKGFLKKAKQNTTDQKSPLKL